VDISRCLVPLVAQSVREGPLPAVLLDTLRDVARAAPAGPHSLVLARCAAAAGEAGLAVDLWEAALAGDTDHAGAGRQELAAYLCHLAVGARLQGDDLGTVKTLRRAASVLGATPPEPSVAAVAPPSPVIVPSSVRSPRLQPNRRRKR